MNPCATDGAVFGTGSPTTALRCRYRSLPVIIMLGGSFLILVMNTRAIIFTLRQPSGNVWDVYQHTITSKINYTIKTDGCSIPQMEPLVRQYVTYPSNLQECPDSRHRLLETDNVQIWVSKNNAPNTVEKSGNNMSCCYQAFKRPYFVKVTSDSNDERVIYDDCKYFDDHIKVEDEFVKVGCFVDSKKIYEQYFLFAPKKELSEIAERSKSKMEPAYNVLILGIDAVSRLNFIRTMPKTVNFLKKNDAVEMVGYNKVGDNSLPNLIPMLLGTKQSELRKLCIPHHKAFFDNCPFVWKWFKQAGYHTAFGEDSSSLGTFNYFKAGFFNAPTDYYIHTFMGQAEKNVGTYKQGNSKTCMHDIPFYKVLLNYVEDLTTTLKNSKLFGFFWEITMSHDFLNYPMIMDNDYEQTLKRLEAKNYLNNTILVVVSDHGIRWGGIRQTNQGRLEERLPFLYILTPPSFRTKYSYAYENLKINSQRLTTPFDLHATLSDLVNPTIRINDISILDRTKSFYSKDRSISLFLPVPYNRTCKAADIDDHWCTCYKYIAAPKKNILVLEAVTELISSLNKMLRDYLQCARLKLSKVLDANLMVVGKTEENEVEWDKLMVVVATDPGDAIFEATLRKDGNGWKLLGSVSRINLYGKQSHCVDDSLLKLYCYCI